MADYYDGWKLVKRETEPGKGEEGKEGEGAGGKGGDGKEGGKKPAKGSSGSKGGGTGASGGLARQVVDLLEAPRLVVVLARSLPREVELPVVDPPVVELPVVDPPVVAVGATTARSKVEKAETMGARREDSPSSRLDPSRKVWMPRSIILTSM